MRHFAGMIYELIKNHCRTYIAKLDKKSYPQGKALGYLIDDIKLRHMLYFRMLLIIHIRCADDANDTYTLQHNPDKVTQYIIKKLNRYVRYTGAVSAKHSIKKTQNGFRLAIIYTMPKTRYPSYAIHALTEIKRTQKLEQSSRTQKQKA
ncbi:hypothetical protein [uncultured Helicobacter sp.]|nr:hypothetical protein [uncultured Helicobacter sp.]